MGEYEDWYPTAFKAEYPPKVDWVSLDDFMHLKRLYDQQRKIIDKLEQAIQNTLDTGMERYIREVLITAPENPDRTEDD